MRKKKQGKWISFSGVANDQVAPSFSNGMNGVCHFFFKYWVLQKNNGWKSPKGNGRNSSDDEDKRPDNNYIVPTRQEQMEMDKDFIDVIFCRVVGFISILQLCLQHRNFVLGRGGTSIRGCDQQEYGIRNRGHYELANTNLPVQIVS